MRRKLFPKKAVLFFMVFATVFTYSKTYAYWGENTIIYSTQSVPVVNIGNWNNAFTWSKFTNYYIGDRVKYNNVIYEAIKDNINVVPDSKNGSKFWMQITI